MGNGAKFASDAIVHVPISDIVADRLKKHIWDKTLPASQKILEAELCKQMGVSRTTMRKALWILEKEGLLEHIPGRGMVVLALPDSSRNFGREVLEALNLVSAKIAKGRMDPTQLTRMRTIQHQLCSFWEKGDVDASNSLDCEFHGIILKACGNPVLQECINLAQKCEKEGALIGTLAPERHRLTHEEMLLSLETDIIDSNTKCTE